MSYGTCESAGKKAIGLDQDKRKNRGRGGGEGGLNKGTPKQKYTRVLTKKYHIPELKWPGIPYTQNPWPGLKDELFEARKSFEVFFLQPNL